MGLVVVGVLILAAVLLTAAPHLTLAGFIKKPAEYPAACCGDESGQPEGQIK